MFYEYVLSFSIMLMLVSFYVYFLSVSFNTDAFFMCMSGDFIVTATDMCSGFTKCVELWSQPY